MENETTLLDLAHKIATDLPGWDVDEKRSRPGYPEEENDLPTRVYLIHQDGAQIALERLGYQHTITDQDRLKISPVWPGEGGSNWQHVPHEPRSKAITISCAKTTAQIATDIQHRLLRHFLPEWERMRADADWNAERKAEALRYAGELAARLGGKVGPAEPGADRFTITIPWNVRLSVRAEVFAYGNVDLYVTGDDREAVRRIVEAVGKEL